MKNEINDNEFHYKSVYEVLNNQHDYLKTESIKTLKILNTIYDKSFDIIKKYNPKALIFLNQGQESFEISFGIINQSNDFHFFENEFSLIFNDGESFGIENYEYSVENYPTEDLFWCFRTELLGRMFYIWFLECIWNSNLIKLEIPIIYSDSSECDNIFDLKDGLSEYHDLTFLDK